MDDSVQLELRSFTAGATFKGRLLIRLNVPCWVNVIILHNKSAVGPIRVADRKVD